MKRFKAIWGVILVFLILVGHEGLAEPNIKKVLLLNSYHAGYKWTEDITKGVLQTLSEHPEIVTYVEYLDAKRFPNRINEERFSNLFKEKYLGETFDLIVTSDNDALDFVLHNIDASLFRNVPHVSCGIGNPQEYEQVENLWLVHELFTYRESISLIVNLLPDMKEFIYVTDALTTGQIYIDDIRALFSEKYPHVKLTIYDCIHTDELPSFFSAINYPSVVYVGVVNSDCDDNPLNEFDVARLIKNNTNAPLFSGYFTEVLDGFIGGVTMDGMENGQMAAELGVDLLMHNEIPNEKIHVPDMKVVFDYDLMKAYGLSKSKLPSETVFLNEPENFWQKNKTLLIISGLIIANLLVVIIILLRSVQIQKRYQKELHFAINKANESDKLKSVFLENVSHEMRTPLNSIVGFSDVLLEIMPDGQDKEFMKIISENALDLNSIISDIFDFSLLKSHKAELEISEFDLLDLLQQVVKYSKLKDKLVNNNIRLINDHESHLKSVPLIADKEKTYQVLKHVFDNACKFSPNGSITVSIRYTSSNQPYSSEDITGDTPQSKYVLIRITDTGKGISDEFMEYLFDPFRHDDENSTNANRGLGLGLSISKSNIEIMGGKIVAHSVKGKGTTMAFTIPVDISSLKSRVY